MPKTPKLTDALDINALVIRLREQVLVAPTMLVRFFEEIADALEAQQAVVEAAQLFVKEGTILTYCDDIVQKVIEHKDKSDPHYKLGEALATLNALPKGNR